MCSFCSQLDTSAGGWDRVVEKEEMRDTINTYGEFSGGGRRKSSNRSIRRTTKMQHMQRKERDTEKGRREEEGDTITKGESARELLDP